jgi:hypothetical protein
MLYITEKANGHNTVQETERLMQELLVLVTRTEEGSQDVAMTAVFAERCMADK